MANSTSSYRRLNALGFLCGVGALVYAVLQLQTDTLDLTSPLSSLARLLLLLSVCLFLLALVHNPGKSGQRFYSFFNLLFIGSGISAAAYHLWIKNHPELVNTQVVAHCQQPFEQLISQQSGFSEKVSLLYQTAIHCSAEAQQLLNVGIAEQIIVLFLLLFVLVWKIIRKQPKPQSMFS